VKAHVKNWLVSLVLLLAATVAHSQTTTYVATATGNYTLLFNFTPPCAIAPCENFNTGIGASGSFTLAAPLPANQPLTNIAPLVTAFSFSDGLHTFASTDAAVRVYLFNVATDASGGISATDIRIERFLTGTSPYAPGDRLAMVEFQATGAADYNAPCVTVGVSPAGVADTCILKGTDTNRSLAFGSARVWSIAVAATPAIAVPALSEWGAILMAAVGALAGLVMLRSRRQR
jgi:hypothetical protein